MNQTPTSEAFSRWTRHSPVPRPVLIFAALIVLLAGLKALTGGLGANQPTRVAMAISEGLMSVFHDDEGLKNMVLIFTKDGKNDDGTVEVRGFGAGLGAMLFGGTPRVGGKVYFHNYEHKSGVLLNGGPHEVELSNANTDKEKAARYRVQGSVTISGSDQPVYVQLEFISTSQTYAVEQMTGKVKINGSVTALQP